MTTVFQMFQERVAAAIYVVTYAPFIGLLQEDQVLALRAGEAISGTTIGDYPFLVMKSRGGAVVMCVMYGETVQYQMDERFAAALRERHPALRFTGIIDTVEQMQMILDVAKH